MKPAVDEMFPEGAGPYVDLEEVAWIYRWLILNPDLKLMRLWWDYCDTSLVGFVYTNTQMLNCKIFSSCMYLVCLHVCIHPSIYLSIYLSIYPSSSPGPGRGGSRLSRAPQASFSPATLCSSSWGIRGVPRPDEIYNPSSGFRVCPRGSPRSRTCPENL